MNANVVRAAERLGRVVRESYPCATADEYAQEDETGCEVDALSTAAKDLLEELYRAGEIPVPV